MGTDIQPYPDPPVAPAVQTYIGAKETVLEQVLAAFAEGRIRRYDPPTELDGGRVLVIGYPVVSSDSAHTDKRPTSGRRWWSQWPVYAQALGALIGAAILAVGLFMLVMGLHAVVVWTQTHALQVGTFVVIGGAAALVFLFALARARHGGHSYGGRY